MDIRPSQPTDRDACLSVFDTLELPELRPAFEVFLENPPGSFLVMEHEGVVVGCGGYAVRNAISTLQWGMIRRESQRQGLGRFLLLYRLREIGRAGNVQVVIVQTPAASAPFFEKQGFRTVSSTTTPSTTAQVELQKKLAVCA